MVSTDPRFGPYVATRLLGRGGGGEVWLADDPALARSVALKLLRATDDPEAIARFRREALILARLRHPNIAVLYAYGVEGNRPWLAMQLVEGATLDRERPSDPRAAARIVRDAARGVAYAHAHGVIHRDLKPGNVMVGPDGRVTVMDFGLARGQAGIVTAAGTIVGTPAYMAPEQAHAGDLDARADVYSLGATLYDLLTGGPPFRGDTVEILTQVMAGAVEPPHVRTPGVDRALEALVMRCMDKNPAHRYPNAAALADDLDRWLATGTIARRPARPTSVRRGVRRRTLAGVLAALAALGLAAVLVAVRTGRGSAETLVERIEAETAEFGGPASADARRRALDALSHLETRTRDPLLLARARWALGDVDGADRELDTLGPNPTSVDALRLRARVRLERFHRYPACLPARDEPQARRDAVPALWQRATEALGQLAARGTDDPVDRALVARYLHQHLDAACAHLERARSPEAAFWMARWTGTPEWQERAVAPGPRCADALVDRARHATMCGDWSAAVADADLALSIQPGHAGAAYALALAYHARALDLFFQSQHAQALGVSIEAIARLDAVERIEPRSPWPAMLRARLIFEDCVAGGHMRGMQVVAAELACAIELAPDCVPARLQRVWMYCHMDRPDLALPDVLRLLEISPTTPRVHLAAGSIMATLPGREDEAVRHLNIALSGGENPGHVLFRRGQALLAKGLCDAAIADFLRAIDARWRVPDAYYLLGRARAIRGSHAAAVRDYDEALKANPDNFEAHFWRAQSRGSIGNLEGAEADYTKFLEHDPRNVEALYGRATVRRLRKNVAGALADADLALSSAPPGWSGRDACEKLRVELRSQP